MDNGSKDDHREKLKEFIRISKENNFSLKDILTGFFNDQKRRDKIEEIWVNIDKEKK